MSLTRRHLLALSAAGAAVGAWRVAFGRAAPEVFARERLNPPGGDLRLALISDLNGPYGSTTYIDTVHRGVGLIPSLKPDLVLCAGDMVAGQKRGLGRDRLDAMWRGFDRDVLQPLRRGGHAFAPAMGNHDASSARSGGAYLFAEDRAAAAQFWRQRRDRLGLEFIDGADFPFAYAFRTGDLFVLVWDASAAVVPAAQLAWADRLLASPAARRARHRLVMGHLPLRAVGQGRDRPGEVLREADRIQALLERHRVEAYVSGHHHAWFPGRIGGLDLIQLGALGSGPRRLLGQSAPGFQTLTVVEFSSDAGERRESAVDLHTLRSVPPERLPDRLTDREGRVQRRRLAEPFTADLLQSPAG